MLNARNRGKLNVSFLPPFSWRLMLIYKQHYSITGQLRPFKSSKSCRMMYKYTVYTTIQTIGINMIKKKNLFFIMNALNWSDMTVKTFMMLHKISISNKCCSFELSIQRIPMYPNVKMYQFPQEYDAAQLFSTWIIIKNVSWAGNQQIIMTSFLLSTIFIFYFFTHNITEYPK